jgi:glycerol-3-phosphate acyltransferase PlsX
MRLALDAFGGDHAPEVCVDGAVAFAKEHPSDVVLLVGDKHRLEPLLAKHPKSSVGNVHPHHASQVVGMGEHGPQAIRGKKDSSLRRCIELHRDGQADAFVSAGNSGAVMAGATLLCGRVEGVTRPAFAALLPQVVSADRPAVMLDAGANTECTAEMLAQFAVLGEAWARSVLHVAKPKVALLSNGEEVGKGTELTRKALELLKKSPLNVIGYVEGNVLFTGHCDVVVTDGFTGNVALKTSEGAAVAVATLLKGAIERAGLTEKMGALLLKPTLGGLRKVVDYAEYGGAPMLGIDGVGIVAHGRSKGRAIERALVAARRTAQAGLKQMQVEAMKAAAAWLP